MRPPTPAGAATRTGIWSTSRPSSATPASCDAAAGQHEAGGQDAAWPAAAISSPSFSKISRMRASMMLADLEPRDRPAALLADDLDLDDLVGLDRVEVAGAEADLELLGHGEVGLEPDGHVVGDVDAAERQDRGVERRAVEEERHVGRAGADVGDGHAQLALRLGEHRLARGERRDDQLVDAHAGLADALGQVLERGRAAVDDVRLDLEADGAHADGVLDALLAVDR